MSYSRTTASRWQRHRPSVEDINELGDLGSSLKTDSLQQSSYSCFNEPYIYNPVALPLFPNPFACGCEKGCRSLKTAHHPSG